MNSHCGCKAIVASSQVDVDAEPFVETRGHLPIVNLFYNFSGIFNAISIRNQFISQLLAMDASARVTMKDAAKCDKRREWQNSENQ